MRPWRSLSLLSVLALGLSLLGPAVPASAAPPAPPAEISAHGTIPLTATTIAGAASGTMPDGSARVWAAVSGSPAYLAEIDPVTGAMLNSYPLKASGGAWGVELAADGTVWVAAYGVGHLYYLAPGATEVVDAGRPTPNTSFMWQVDTDAQGVAYVGTFEGFGVPVPPAHLASFDRATGQWRDYGTFGAPYNYVRSTAVVGDKVYVGTGTTAAMFEVDIATGAKREIPLPADRTGCQFTYEMATSGTDIYVRFDCTKQAFGAVYDTVTGTWEGGPWPGYNMQRVGTDEAGNTYFGIANRLWRRAVDGTMTNLGVSVLAKGVGVARIDGQEHVLSVNANLMNRYNIATGELTQISTQLLGTPVAVRSQAMGPDGRIHFGGYFSGGFASFSQTEGWHFDPRLGQAEGLVTVGDRFYAGVYPGAKIYEVDVTRQLTAGNPRLVANLTTSGQDRPFGMEDAGGLLAIGTVAGYGDNKGQLSIYDPATGKLDEYPNIIPDQGIVSLAYADGVLYGGTSIFGGTSTVPTTENARVFAFDMATRTLLWNREVVGHKIVSAVEATNGGQVWASTVGTLFAFKTDTGREVYQREVAPYDWSTFQGGTWQYDSLAFNPSDGHLYGSVRGRIVKIKPVGQREMTVLDGVSGSRLVLDGQRTYWVSGQQLFSAVWPKK